MTWSRICLLLVALVCAATAHATSVPMNRSEPDPVAEIYRTIPQLFYEGRPDSLLNLLDEWETEIGPREVITRTRILGAVWDGAFTEDLYDANILRDLAWREAEFRDPPPDPDVRVEYDAFTVDLADQLLPHQPAGTPERFFCLFYAGRTGEAWAMLEDGRLPHTDLGYYHARRQVLAGARQPQLTLAITGGSWTPRGDLEFVGDQPLIGLLGGWWDDPWFARLAAEWRPGRTSRPYWVLQDGQAFLSDRWNAALAGLEVGRSLASDDLWRLDAFVGAGLDLVKPLGDSAERLVSLHLAYGVGFRWEPDPESWYWGVDLRLEQVADRNEDAVNLGGDAWSMRFVVGRTLSGTDSLR